MTLLTLPWHMANQPAMAAEVSTNAATADAANPTVKVPVHTYRSVFSSASQPVVPVAKPEDWAQANATVGQYAQGHADILRAETKDTTAQERP